MDILKLLSRSTKQPNKALTSKDKQPKSLPSAGVNANPQLFHDEIPGARGKKRKRGGDVAVDDAKSHDDQEIDFFAPKSAVINAKSSSKQDAKLEKTAATKAPQEAPKTLDEGECRQVMKEHRLKINILPALKVEKKVKKPKKAKIEEAPKKQKPIEIYPQPLEAFSDLGSFYGIHGRLRQNLADQAYKIPTEVQMGSLPLLLNPEVALSSSPEVIGSKEVDLLAVAPTGSGKTLAFLIPIANQILQQRRRREDKTKHILEAVVVAPTKELASQIVNEAKKLCLGTGIKVVGMRKGMRFVANDEEDEDELQQEESEEDESADEETKAKPSKQPITRTDILITTPGLLATSLTHQNESIPLPTVRTLVLDEADVLLDPLFRDQTLAIWSSLTHTSLRVNLWSATMGSNIESLALSTISSRLTRLSIPKPAPIIRLVVGLKDSAIPNITHTLTYTATEPGKLLALRQLLHPSSSDSTTSLRPPFIVFTQTIPRAIALHSELLYDIPASAGGSSRLAVLHSSLSDPVRSQIMTRFRSGEIWILITTDILSRGVDFKGVNGVVNYDVPNSAASYIHRVGRTGRAGRDGGVAVTFYTKEDIPYVKAIANIISVSEKQGGRVPAEGEGVKKWLLNSLPNVSKDKRKELKLHGVEARRDHSKGKQKDGEKNGKGKAKMQISTKSGYERKVENRRKGAIEGSKRRAALYESEDKVDGEGGEAVEWGGFED